MKCFLALALLLVAGQAQAGFLDDAYNTAVIPTFNTLVDKIKEVAQHLTGKLQEALLAALQQISGTNKRDARSDVCVTGPFGISICVGKRDLGKLDALVQKLKEIFADKAQAVKDKIQLLLGKLKELQQNIVNGNILGKPITETVQELENAVENNKREVRGLLSDLIQQTISSLPIKDVLTQIGNQLLNGLLGNLGQALGKRGISDFFQSIGDFFKPHVDNAVNLLTGIGNTIQGHAQNLWDTLTGHVSSLGDKLSVHVQNIVDHGTQIHGHVMTAFEALKETIGDIVSQTITNVTPNVNNITQSLTDGQQNIIDHLIG